MDIQKLISFYYKEITANEFMEFLNSEIELQLLFNKSLKNSPPSNFNGTPTAWLNKIYNNKDNDKREFLVWLYVKEFLSKGKNIQYLSREDVISEILNVVTDLPNFYNADIIIEQYIKDKIISTMPQIETLNKSIKYVKEKLNECFKSDEKSPKWIQNCEWPFDKNGEPLVFKEQNGNFSNMKYIFYNTKTNEETIIKQFD